MNLELEAMALAMPEVAKHPNRLPFYGVLTLVGIASQRPPSGARGHRVMLTRRGTEAALPSLLGMALDYAPSLDAHDARRKIGIITEAEIVPLKATTKNEFPQGLKPLDHDDNYGAPFDKLRAGSKDAPLQNSAQPGILQQSDKPEFEELRSASLKACPFETASGAVSSTDSAGQIAISGYLYAHDFPDVVDELRAGNGSLGMSYEIANAHVPSPASPIWTVTSFTFTGAAVLRREKAAYPETWIAIHQANSATSSPVAAGA